MAKELQRIVVLCVIVVGAFAGIFFLNMYRASQEPAPIEEPVFCTADAMQCSDGSWVGRTGPNCEFVCPEGSANSSAQPQ